MFVCVCTYVYVCTCMYACVSVCGQINKQNKLKLEK